MSNNLTPKQEAFCLAYMETGNASEAYRRAYNAENTKPDVIHVKASQLLANGKLAVRMEQLRQDAVKRNEITVDDLIKELEEARNAALNSPNPQAAAMTSATMGKAKLLGFLVDKVDSKIEGNLTVEIVRFGGERNA